MERAIAEVVLNRSPILVQRARPVAAVAAFAKTDLAPGTAIDLAIGGTCVYGMIDRAETLKERGAVPICLLDRETGPFPSIRRRVAKDSLLTWDDIELPPSPMLDMYRHLERLFDTAHKP